MRSAFLVVFLVGAALVSAACGPEYRGFREEVREHTYPRSFRYVERGEIRGVMAQLAVRVYDLDRALDAEPDLDREWIAELLRQMHGELGTLGSGGWPSNHPGFAANAQQLELEVKRALVHVERDPPSYYWASTVSAACLRCHAREHSAGASSPR